MPKSGHSNVKSWPAWALVMAGVLIGMSILWIPFIAILKLAGITVFAPEPAGWFPAEELKAFYELKDHIPTKIERILFGFRDDGREGVLFPTLPRDNVAPKIDKSATFEVEEA